MKTYPLKLGVSAAILLLLLTAIFSAWQNSLITKTGKLQSNLNSLEALHHQLNTSSERILFYVNLAGYTGQKNWESEYDREFEILQTAFVANESRINKSSLSLMKIQSSLDEVDDIAQHIFSEVRGGRADTAKTLVESFEFEQRTEFFRIQVSQLNTNLADQAELLIGEIEDIRRPISFVSIIIFLLSAGLVFTVGKSFMKWQATLTSMNSDLESRVKSQTAELQDKSAQILINSRLATLGEVAAGISHEINNPLSVILAKVSLLQRRLSLDANLKSDLLLQTDLSKIREMAERITRIIKSLKAATRLGEGESKSHIHCVDLIETSLGLVEHRMGAQQIELVRGEMTDTMLKINETQISQVLVILLNNAIEAVSGTENPWIKVSSKKVGSCIKIEVQDSGLGIPETVRENMFNPFYSTKKKQDGVGLGLPLAKKIIENHEGRLYLDETSANTKFVIELKVLNGDE